MAGLIDVSSERAATPGCARLVHLNNAGAALPTSATLEVVVAHLRREAHEGGYEAAAAAADELDAVRTSAATLLNAERNDVVLTGSDTQAWAKALWGLVLGGGIAAGQVLLVDRMAYDSHYLGLLQVCELVGSTIEVVPSGPDGAFDLGQLDHLLSGGRVAMGSLTHVGTHRGLVNPVEEAGPLFGRSGVPFFLDACQSVGQLPVDVARIGCDVLTATGRKWLRGPRGTGLLFVRGAFAERLRPPGVGGRAAAWEGPDRFRLRDGTERFVESEAPIAAQLGLGAAIDHALALGIDSIAERTGSLAETLRGRLRELDGVELQDGEGRRCGIVTFTVSGTTPAAVAAAAGASGVNVSVSGAPFARLDMVPPRPDAVVRASPHYYNNTEELDRLVDVVRSVGGAPDH